MMSTGACISGSRRGSRLVCCHSSRRTQSSWALSHTSSPSRTHLSPAHPIPAWAGRPWRTSSSIKVPTCSSRGICSAAAVQPAVHSRRVARSSCPTCRPPTTVAVSGGSSPLYVTPSRTSSPATPKPCTARTSSAAQMLAVAQSATVVATQSHRPTTGRAREWARWCAASLGAARASWRSSMCSRSSTPTCRIAVAAAARTLCQQQQQKCYCHPLP